MCDKCNREASRLVSAFAARFVRHGVTERAFKKYILVMCDQCSDPNCTGVDTSEEAWEKLIAGTGYTYTTPTSGSGAAHGTTSGTTWKYVGGGGSTKFILADDNPQTEVTLEEREALEGVDDVHTCVCDSYILMHFGCKCGAFANEMKLKGKRK